MLSDPPDFNPYSSPTTEIGHAATNDAAMRRAHLSHEANIKSFGCLYYLGAFFIILAGFFLLISVLTTGGGGLNQQPGDQLPAMFMGILGGTYIVVGGLQFWVAYGLRSLSTAGRIGGTVFGALGLLAFPIGTIISGFLLYLLWSQKGNVVFSDEYKRVIAATPGIKYKTSIIAWMALGLIILLGIGMVIAIFSGL